jgi:hypothetical protein
MATVTIVRAVRTGDLVTATGTVDGKPYTVNCWLSHLNTLPNRAAKVAYVAGLLKDVADQQTPPEVDLTATVTV